MKCEELKGEPCAKCNSHKIIKCEENKSSFVLNNPNQHQVCVVQVDGCYITDGQRCDYIVVVCKPMATIHYLVELKGRHITDAIKQLSVTLDTLKRQLSTPVYGCIVLTKNSVPNIENSPEYIKLRKKLKELGGDVIRKTLKLEETI